MGSVPVNHSWCFIVMLSQWADAIFIVVSVGLTDKDIGILEFVPKCIIALGKVRELNRQSVAAIEIEPVVVACYCP